MISADEARDKTIKKSVIYLSHIENEIKYAMQDGNTNVIITDSPYCNWLMSSTGDSDKDYVLAVIRDYGYKVSHFQCGIVGMNTLAEFASQTTSGLKIDWSGD